MSVDEVSKRERTISGALALGSAAGAPFQGRLIDRRGEGMLLPLAVVHAAGLVAIWLLGEAGLPVALLAVVSLVTGASLPPVSSVLRSRWPYLLPGQPELMAGAFALDSVMIETVFVVGPLITTIVVTTVGPQYALIVSAGCMLYGTAMLLAGSSVKLASRRGFSIRRSFTSTKRVTGLVVSRSTRCRWSRAARSTRWWASARRSRSDSRCSPM